MPFEGRASGDLVLVDQESGESREGDGRQGCQLVLGEHQVLEVVQGLVSGSAEEVDRGNLVFGGLESQQEGQVEDLRHIFQLILAERQEAEVLEGAERFSQFL